MAMIDPTEGKKYERDPEEGNIPTGLYLCELSRVEEVGPSAKYPNGNPRLVFEFTLCDPNHPALNGKKAVAFLGKTLLKTKEGKESNLVKWARMMGVASPEKGFDPDQLLHKRFNVMVELTPGTGGEPGRGWARSVIAAPQAPPAGQPAAAPVSSAPISGHVPSAGDPNARWDYSDGQTVTVNKSSAEVQAWLDGAGAAGVRVKVKPAGTPNTAAKTAEEWGFLVGDPIPF